MEAEPAAHTQHTVVVQHQGWPSTLRKFETITQYSRAGGKSPLCGCILMADNSQQDGCV